MRKPCRFIASLLEQEQVPLAVQHRGFHVPLPDTSDIEQQLETLAKVEQMIQDWCSPELHAALEAEALCLGDTLRLRTASYVSDLERGGRGPE